MRTPASHKRAETGWLPPLHTSPTPRTLGEENRLQLLEGLLEGIVHHDVVVPLGAIHLGFGLGEPARQVALVVRAAAAQALLERLQAGRRDEHAHRAIVLGDERLPSLRV